MSTSPSKPISSTIVPWVEVADVPRFSIRYRHPTLGAVGEDYHVGVAIEELAPGMRSNPAHYHIFEEEHVYVLEGSMTVRIGAGSYEMKAGDYACFPAGQNAGHGFVNESGAVCRYVILGENRPDEVAVYTDSKKVLVRSLGRRAIFDLSALRGYWDGEDTGLPDGESTSSEASTDALDGAASIAPPIASGDVEWTIEGEGPRFGGRSKHLTYAAVGRDYHVGVLIESPAPDASVPQALSHAGGGACLDPRR